MKLSPEYQKKSEENKEKNDKEVNKSLAEFPPFMQLNVWDHKMKQKWFLYFAKWRLFCLVLSLVYNTWMSIKCAFFVYGVGLILYYIVHRGWIVITSVITRITLNWWKGHWRAGMGRFRIQKRVFLIGFKKTSERFCCSTFPWVFR